MKSAIQIGLVLVTLAGTGAWANSARACDRSGYSVRYYRPVHVVEYQPAPTRLVVARPAPRPSPAYAVESGSTIGLDANFLGREPGHVLVRVGGLTFECEIKDWATNKVIFRLPRFGMPQDTTARIDLVRPEGRVVKSVKVMLVQRNPLEVYPDDAEADAIAESPISEDAGHLAGQADAADLRLVKTSK